MISNETIAAISTAPGTAGIAIIRISGKEAFEIASKIFVSSINFNKLNSHKITYRKIVDNFNNEIIDEVMLSKMGAPRTYTREDIIEINCHGSFVNTQRILELIFKNGARPAEPGEFTKRAFFNGRIDLSQAEAVMDLINSKTELSSKAALNQLEGRLSDEIVKIKGKLVELIAHIELTLDYPEYDEEHITIKESEVKIKDIIIKLDELYNSFNKGRILKEGLNVVITGKPNVGKSSLLNKLSGKNKAIVTNIPGTTRDIIEEYINIKNIPIRLIDTAGLRKTEDIVESIGVENAYKAIKEADLIIMLFDNEQGITDEDKKILDEIKKSRVNRVIYVLNKIDIVNKQNIELIKTLIENENILYISIKENEGIEKLEERIFEIYNLNDTKINDQVLITNIRHKDLIRKSIENLKYSLDAIAFNQTLDIISVDIKNALINLTEILGESVNEEIIKEIFSKFCVGK